MQNLRGFVLVWTVGQSAVTQLSVDPLADLRHVLLSEQQWLHEGQALTVLQRQKHTLLYMAEENQQTLGYAF